MNKKNIKTNKAIKFRIYPNLQQQGQIDKTIGCARLVYNLMLDYHKKRYINKEKYQSYFNSKKYFIANIKNQEQYNFLKEVDKWALDNSIQNLDFAFQRFFNNCKKHKKVRKVIQNLKVDILVRKHIQH